MKKLLLSFLVFLALGVKTHAQNFIATYSNMPSANSYSCESHGNSVIINNKIYSAFTGWQFGFSSLNIIKADLNGNLLAWRKEDSLLNKAAPSKLFTGNNRLYYICKNQLTVADTNLFVNYISTYTTSVPNTFWYFNDGLVATNGDIVLVGAAATYSSGVYSNIKTLVVRINALNGNLIYSKTFDNTTQTIATSVLENTANASLFISGRVINSGYSTFLLNISNDNLGTLNSSKYFLPGSGSYRNMEVRKMIIHNSNLFLFARDSSAKLMVTKTNINLTATFQTKYYSNFIFQDAFKMAGNSGFYVCGYGPKTFTSVPFSIIQLDTALNNSKSVIFSNLTNYYDSLSNFSLDYYNGLNGATGNYGANIFEKNNLVYCMLHRSNSANTFTNQNQIMVKESPLLNSPCVSSFSLNNNLYSYNISPTTFTGNSVSANNFTQTTVIANLIPVVSVACGTAAITQTPDAFNEHVTKFFVFEKNVYFKNFDFNNTSFEVLTLDGRKVFSAQLNNGQTKVNLSALPEGIYISRLYYNSEILCKKVVIN